MARDLVPIGDVLGRLLKRLGLERRTREARIALEWGRVVGETIARHSKPVGVRGKTELDRYFKGAMLEKIRDELGERRIVDIRFRIGEI